MALTSLGYLQQPPDALHPLLPPSLSPFEAVLPSDRNAIEKLEEEDRFIGYLFRAFGFIERSLPISPYLLTAPFNGFNLYASSTCAADDNGRPCVRARLHSRWNFVPFDEGIARGMDDRRASSFSSFRSPRVQVPVDSDTSRAWFHFKKRRGE